LRGVDFILEKPQVNLFAESVDMRLPSATVAITAHSFKLAALVFPFLRVGLILKTFSGSEITLLTVQPVSVFVVYLFVSRQNDLM